MKKLIAMMLMLASVFFIACEEEEKEKTFLEKLDVEMAADIEEMKNAEGFKAMAALNNLSDPFSTTKGKIGSPVFSEISKYLVPFNYTDTKVETEFKGDPFDFESWVGTFTWNNEYQAWDVTHGVPSDKIIIVFPSDENNMGNNDATLTIHSFQEVQIYVDDFYGGYYEYYPTEIDADLYIDDTKYVGIDLLAEWDIYGEPQSLDIDVYLAPFTFSGDLARTTYSVTVGYDIYLNQTLIFGAEVGATFVDETYENPIDINGYIQYRTVKVQADIGIREIMAVMEDLNSEQPTYTAETALAALNEAMDMGVYKDQDKVADIVMKYDEEEGVIFVLDYVDGGEENAEEFFNSFITHIEELMEAIGFYLDETY